MKPFLKLFLHSLLAICPLGAVAALVMATLPALSEKDEAAARYLHTVEELNRQSAELAAVEGRLHLLTTSLEAVEREVRTELRMVKPGERLVLIRHAQTTTSSPAAATGALEPSHSIALAPP